MTEIANTEWSFVEVGDVAEVRGGSAFPLQFQGQISGYYPFYKVSDMNIVGNEVRLTRANNWVTEDVATRLKAKAFAPGTVVFPKVGAAIFTNKKRLLSCDALVDNNVMGATPRNGRCLPEFLFHWFESIDLRDFSNPGPLPSINSARVKRAVIHLPSVAEQKAIVAALASVERAKSIRRLELMREVEFRDALREYLFQHGTRDERKTTTALGHLPESWNVHTLGDLSDVFQYGTSRKCDSTNGVPVLGIPNVVTTRVVLEGAGILNVTDAEKKKLMLKSGDVLFVRTNATRENTGRCAVFNCEAPEVLFASYLIRVRVKIDIMLPSFLREYALTSLGKSFLSGRASPAADGKFNINTQTLRSVVVPVPPLEEQQEICSGLEASERKVSALRKELSRLTELYESMLADFFSQKLSAVPLVEEASSNE